MEEVSEWGRQLAEDVPLLGLWFGVTIEWGVETRRVRASLLR